MGAVRRVGDTLLWVLAAFGVLAGAVWVANAVGWVQPLVVVSGSMQPAIATGDLLFAVPVDGDELEVGEVATLPNPQTGRLVTHRVISIEHGVDELRVRMQGDANQVPDPRPYAVDPDEVVWHPVVTVPGAGALLERVMRPSVAVPALIALVALVALTLVPAPRPGRHARDREAQEVIP